MAIDIRKYERLKQQRDDLREKISRAKGRQEQLLSQMKSEFGVESLAAAKKELARLEKEAEEAEKEYEDALTQFEAEWEEKIG